MSSFAQHYRALVLPQLARLAKAEAACIAAGVEDYPDAMAVLYRHARALGMGFLPESLQDQLDDWMASTLLLELRGAGAI